MRHIVSVERPITSQEEHDPAKCYVEETTGYDGCKVGRLGHSIAKASRLEESLCDELKMRGGQDFARKRCVAVDERTWCCMKKMAMATGIPQYTGNRAKAENERPNDKTGLSQISLFWFAYRHQDRVHNTDVSRLINAYRATSMAYLAHSRNAFSAEIVEASVLESPFPWSDSLQLSSHICRSLAVVFLGVERSPGS